MTATSLPLRPVYARVATVLLSAVVLTGCSDDSRSAAPTPVASASSLLDKALAASAAGDTDAAKRDFEALAAQDPTNKLAPYNLAVIAQQAGDEASAVANYNKALAIDPNYEPALYNLAIITAKTDEKAAIALYERAVVADPKDANAHYNLGLLLQKSGNAERAVKEINEAIKLNPKLKAPTAPTS